MKQKIISTLMSFVLIFAWIIFYKDYTNSPFTTQESVMKVSLYRAEHILIDETGVYAYSNKDTFTKDSNSFKRDKFDWFFSHDSIIKIRPMKEAKK